MGRKKDNKNNEITKYIIQDIKNKDFFIWILD